MISDFETDDTIKIFPACLSKNNSERVHPKFSRTTEHSVNSSSDTFECLNDSSSYKYSFDDCSRCSREDDSTDQLSDYSKYEDEKGSVCPICYCDYTSLSLLNPCYHAFCLSCIKTWAKRSNRCPMCNSHFAFAYYDFSPSSPLICKKFFFHLSDKDDDIVSLEQKLDISNENLVSTNLFPNCTTKILSRREIYILGFCPQELKEINLTFPAKILNGHEYQEKLIRRWIVRDLNAIFPETNMEILVMHIIGCIKSSFNSITETIIGDIKEYLEEYAVHFFIELILFSKSKLTPETYDKVTKYIKIDGPLMI